MVAGRDGCGVVSFLAALQIRISHTEALPELLAALARRVNFVVEALPPDRVAVSVLGSFADAGEHELAAFLQDWNATRPGPEAQVERDEPRGGVLIPLPTRARTRETTRTAVERELP